MDLSNLTGNYWVTNDAHWTIVFGAKLCVCHDSSVVFSYDDIPNARKVAFLPENRLLISGGKNTSYRMISLVDGQVIWKIPPIKHMSVSADRFALSGDGRYAYDSYSWKDGNHIVRISLQSGKMECFLINEGLRTLMDISCDDSGNLRLLQTELAEKAGVLFSRNEIRQVVLDTVIKNERIHFWEDCAESVAKCFWDFGKSILTKNLYVYDPERGQGYSLIENDPLWMPPGLGPNLIWSSNGERYVFVMYDNANIVFDCYAKKVIACYSADFVKGCLVGNNYWVWKNGHLEIKPFPKIEPVLAVRKAQYW